MKGGERACCYALDCYGHRTCCGALGCSRDGTVHAAVFWAVGEAGHTYSGAVGCCMTEHDVLLGFVETVHAVVNVVVVEIRMLFCCRLLRK
jgi:hypothetical protein